MSAEMEIAAAVERERQTRDPLFVHIRPDVAHLPGIREALGALADETGRTLVRPIQGSHYEKMVRESAVRMADAPVIDRADRRKILENIAGIAAHKIRVT